MNLLIKILQEVLKRELYYILLIFSKKVITGPLMREIMNTILGEFGKLEAENLLL